MKNTMFRKPFIKFLLSENLKNRMSLLNSISRDIRIDALEDCVTENYCDSPVLGLSYLAYENHRTVDVKGILGRKPRVPRCQGVNVSLVPSCLAGRLEFACRS